MTTTAQKAAHTPGPWRDIPALNDPASAYHIYGGPNGSTHVATIAADDDSDAANARLIAAAPEMHAELVAITNLPGFEPSEPYGLRILALLARIHDA